ncbi:MAG: M23 family metallopeptidase [Bacteroidetes bacterium]|nr:M23 family metallopeptidase [Bacteroidota bacterium]
MLYFRIILASILIFNTVSDNPIDRTVFISPVNIPLLLSANFGELRIDHFHSGIDVKTQGVTGKEVVATADGQIYRISVSPGGFGKALYIKHPSGYSTVYGHLDKFTDEIEEYVKNSQYDKKSFTVTLYPSGDIFRVKQGEIIAYSGNSGSSGGPHLHYEIRRVDNEKPVNPLLFDFGTSDNIAPVIEKLFIYPITANTSINGKNSIKKLDVSGGHGNFYIPADREIIINGPAGFGIKSFDLLNDSYNKCDVYSIELIIDSMTVF